MFVVIYTRPPYPDIKYPYIITNLFDETSFRYAYAPGVKSVIIDSGVYSIFSRLSLKEYPGGYMRWMHKAATWWHKIKTVVPDTYATIPDYPADYPHNIVEDNIEKTIRNIEYAVKRYPDIRWIIPIQGRYNDILSMIKMFEYIADSGILDTYSYTAIANVCTSKRRIHIHQSINKCNYRIYNVRLRHHHLAFLRIFSASPLSKK